MPAFNFGANWQRFSERRLDTERLAAAAGSLHTLLKGVPLEGRSFLDVGCGTGLFSIAAATLGAGPVIGVDVDSTCVAVSEANRHRLAPRHAVDFRQISALDADGLERLGHFKIVYAWGSLHHTGAMWRAIDLVAKRVEVDGTLVLAIYARHFTSPVWRIIKWTYNKMPGPVQNVMALVFGGIIFLAKLAVTGRNPLKKDRGMDFWIDVVDWVGGYPYEYATPAELEARLNSLGFCLVRLVPASVPTGCNEFVFRRSETSA